MTQDRLGGDGVTHLVILIAMFAFIFGLITRAGRLHRLDTQVLISLYVLVSIALYQFAWQEASGAPSGHSARLWVHEPLLGAVTAIEFAVVLWLGKAVASYYVHHIRTRFAVRLGHAQLAIKRAERAGLPPPRRACLTVWLIHRLIDTRQQRPTAPKGDR